jgi:Zn finger protein HypA/HybF involved in hydrogenase expression
MKITSKDFAAFDFNKYEPVFKCECGYEELFWDYKYCPICGAAIEIDDTLLFSDEQLAQMPNDFISANTNA